MLYPPDVAAKKLPLRDIILASHPACRQSGIMPTFEHLEAKGSLMNYLNIRCSIFGMDARREAQRMAIPFASFATPQTPEYAATLRAGAALDAFLRYEPLVVNNTTAYLVPWSASKAAPAYVQIIH